MPWPEERSRVRKGYIRERLARVYIATADWRRAITTLTQEPERFRDPYMNHTLGLAYQLGGQFEQAQSALMQALAHGNNKDVWTTRFLIGTNLMKQNRFMEAREAFKEANNNAVRTGKTNVDSCLVGEAFVCYKLGEREMALQFLRRALELNPSRLAVRRRLESWQQQS